MSDGTWEPLSWERKVPGFRLAVYRHTGDSCPPNERYVWGIFRFTVCLTCNREARDDKSEAAGHSHTLSTAQRAAESALEEMRGA